jgi:hypothetical protein
VNSDSRAAIPTIGLGQPGNEHHETDYRQDESCGHPHVNAGKLLMVALTEGRRFFLADNCADVTAITAAASHPRR